MSLRPPLPLAAALLALLVAAPALAQNAPSAERVIRMNGALPPAAVAGAAEPVRFAIYDAETGGTLLWEETQALVLDGAGQYSALLGATSPDGLPVDLFAGGAARWLSVSRPGQAAGPRTLLTAVPYAVSAATAGNATSLGGRPATDFALTPAARKRDASTAAVSGDAAERDQTPLVNNGTANYIGKFFNNVDLINSQLYDNGTNIGFGTTAPGDKFHVQFTNAGGTQTGLAVQNMSSAAGAYSGMLFYDHTGALRQFQGYNNSTQEYRINNIGPSGSINFMIGSDSKFRVTTSGNISLGGGTFAPASKLQLYGNSASEVTVQGSRHGGSISAPTATTTGSNLLAFEGAGHTGSGFTIERAAIRMFSAENWTPTANGSEIRFYTTTNGTTAITERVRVANDGNVGIGETAPTYKLDILHSNGEGLRLKSSASFSALDIDAFTGDAAIRLANNGVNQWNIRNQPGTDNLQIFELGGGGERMHIQNGTGNVSIGGVTPLDLLHVDGDIRVGTGTTGCVKDANGTVIAGTCSSDLRFKKDVTSFEPLLKRFVQLTPVNYHWRSSEFADKHFGTAGSWGFIAQDVQAVFPDLVATDEQGYLAVNYSKIPLLTVQAVKELKAENDALKAQNDALESRLAAVEAALKALAAGSPQR